jgi:hypothetical protein
LLSNVRVVGMSLTNAFVFPKIVILNISLFILLMSNLALEAVADKVVAVSNYNKLKHSGLLYLKNWFNLRAGVCLEAPMVYFYTEVLGSLHCRSQE